MKKILMAVIIGLTMVSLFVYSAEKEQTTKEAAVKQETKLVVDIKFGTEVDKDKSEILGEATTFPSTIKRVWCLTSVNGAKEDTFVTHYWFYGEKKMAELKLEIKKWSWKTWSYKTMMKEWTGTWTLKVADASGNIIASKEFKLE